MTDKKKMTSPTASALLSQPEITAPVAGTPQQPPPLLHRLNGRPQACDPCRSRKVSCDHAQPVCDRCRKRNQANQCVYTISEQTARTGVTSSTTTALPKLTSRQKRQRKRQKERQDAANTLASSAAARNLERAPTVSSRDERVTQPTRVSYLGLGALDQERDVRFVNHPILRESRIITNPDLPPPTTSSQTQQQAQREAGNAYIGFFSYSTVFDEARSSLSLLSGSNAQATTLAPSSSSTPANIVPSIGASTTQGAPRPGDASSHLSSVNREMCLHVLRSIPDPNFPRLKPLGILSAQLWGRVATARILETLRKKYGDLLKGGGPSCPRDETQLWALAEDICKNSSKPLDGDIVDPETFLDQFAGDDLRWESLGLLFVFREMAPDVNGSGMAPPPEDLGRTWDIWPETGRACLKLCIEISKSFSHGNIIMAYMCSRLSIIDSLVFGDSSVTHWLTHGEAVALATSMGLHALPDPPDYKPSLASEIKRRVFAFIFNIDKVGSSYHGRPPLISHRYTSSPWPLCLPDEALLAGGEELDRQLVHLDENGWNTVEDLGTTTMLRCRVMIHTLKDQLLEIALGHSGNTSVSVLQSIKAQEQAIYDSFPQKCRYRDQDLNETHLSFDTLFCRLHIHIEHLQCRLFAERLLSRHSGPDDGGLLFTSFEIVRHVLIFWMHHDRFTGMRVDYLWMAMSYGAPGGGVLCMELLYPTLPNRPIPYYNSTSPRITRSAIIQQLSLLVGFLGWAGPAAPDAEPTANCKAVIQSVLDYALNNGGGAGGGLQSGDAVPMSLYEGFDAGQFNFGFDTLGTFDWFRLDEAVPSFG